MKLTFHQVLLIGLLFFVFITMTMNSNFFGVESKQFFFFGGGGVNYCLKKMRIY